MGIGWVKLRVFWFRVWGLGCRVRGLGLGFKVGCFFVVVLVGLL